MQLLNRQEIYSSVLLQFLTREVYGIFHRHENCTLPTLFQCRKGVKRPRKYKIHLPLSSWNQQRMLILCSQVLEAYSRNLNYAQLIECDWESTHLSHQFHYTLQRFHIILITSYPWIHRICVGDRCIWIRARHIFNHSLKLFEGHYYTLNTTIFHEIRLITDWISICKYKFYLALLKTNCFFKSSNSNRH